MNRFVASAMLLCATVVCLQFFRATTSTAAQLPKANRSTASPRKQYSHIQGFLMNALNEKPLPGVRVILLQVPDGNAPRVAITGTNGEFRFDHLPPGDYSLTAESALFPLQALRTNQGSLTIAAGDNLVFLLKPESLISGAVMDEHSDPVRNAQVTLLEPSEQGEARVIGQAQTNDLGIYRFAHLLPGRYFLAIKAEPWYAQHNIRISTGSSSNDDPWIQADNTVFNVIYPITYYPLTENLESANAIELQPGQHFVADVTLTPRQADSGGR